MAKNYPEKTTKRVLVILFLFSGLALMGFRWLYVNTDQALVTDTFWRLSLAGHFEVEKGNTTISTTRPKTGRYATLISQRFYHPDLKILKNKNLSSSTVLAKATKSGNTEYHIEYQFRVNQSPKTLLAKTSELSPADRKAYLQSDELIDLGLPSLLLLSEVTGKDVVNKSQLLHKIFSQSQKFIKSKKKANTGLEQVIQSNKATTLGRATLMVALGRLNDFPARLVTGFILDESVSDSPHHWVEVYDQTGSWKQFDPEKGFEGNIPDNYIAFNYNNPEIFSTENGKLVSQRFSIVEDIDASNISLFEQDKKLLEILDLRRLDLDTRQMITKLLVLPFCVLLTVFFRHVLGFFPYGTFTAPLLALAMVYAEPAVTLTVAGVVITLALIGRSILPKSLSRSPRLSLIFTFVAMSMVLSISIMSYLSINPGGNIMLIPTIILVGIVDRFYSYMDEAGKHAALVRLGVTVLIALFCAPLLTIELLGHFTLLYPEFLLIVAALVLILSSYKGIKLTDNKYLAIFGDYSKTKRKSQI